MSDSSMSIKETIVSQIRDIAREQDKNLATLTEDLVLLESGLELSKLRYSRSPAGRHIRGGSV